MAGPRDALLTGGYMLVPAYDFWHLYRTEGGELQMGGSDQWWNITAGIEPIGRSEGNRSPEESG